MSRRWSQRPEDRDYDCMNTTWLFEGDLPLLNDVPSRTINVIVCLHTKKALQRFSAREKWMLIPGLRILP